MNHGNPYLATAPVIQDGDQQTLASHSRWRGFCSFQIAILSHVRPLLPSRHDQPMATNSIGKIGGSYAAYLKAARRAGAGSGDD